MIRLIKIDIATGLFLEDILLDTIPLLTETVPEERLIFDQQGNVIEIRTVGVEKPILDVEGKTIPDPQYIGIPCPVGFYKPRWDGTQWVEGGIALIETPEQEIIRLKAEISETDYKIIKCSEYQLAGLELPYDIAALHTSRQALRDRINEIELGLI